MTIKTGLTKTDFPPIDVLPGDIIEVTYHPTWQEKLLGRKKEVVLRETVSKAYHVTTIGAFEFEYEFGCKRGIGGFFGEGREE